MVLSETNSDTGRVITLLPNRSATWRETQLFLYLFCGTTLAIGVFWAVVGVWAVLPFSGLEAGLLAWLMYRVSHATYQRQRISVNADQVLIQFGRRFPRRTWRLKREGTHLAVIEPLHELDPPGLSIFDSRHNVEVGRFLNRDDKEKALLELKRAGLYVRSHDRLARTSF
jgi:uncharacterized membrane protein